MRCAGRLVLARAPRLPARSSSASVAATSAADSVPCSCAGALALRARGRRSWLSMSSRRARSASAADDACAQRLVELFPVLLPAVHRGFGRGELGRGGLLGGARRFEARAQLGQRRLEFGGLLGGRARGAGPRPAMPCAICSSSCRCRAADLARVLDRLLGARDLGADLVVAALHLGQHRRLRVVLLRARARSAASMERCSASAACSARSRSLRIAWRAPDSVSTSRSRSASSSACSCRSSCFSAW